MLFSIFVCFNGDFRKFRPCEKCFWPGFIENLVKFHLRLKVRLLGFFTGHIEKMGIKKKR